MQTLVGIDIETTGFSHTKDHIIEVAMVVMQYESRRIIRWGPSFEAIVKPEGDYKLATNKAGELISPSLTKDVIDTMGLPIATVITDAILYICDTNPDYLVAHNAAFDRRFLDANGFPCDRFNWIDTMLDCPDSYEEKKPSLSEFVERNGVTWKGETHRALQDVTHMLQALANYGIELAIGD